MKKLTLTTREDARILSDVLEKYLVAGSTGLKRLGVSLSIGRISFGGGTASIKIEAAVLDSSGEAVTKEMKDFTREMDFCDKHMKETQSPYPGIKAADLGETFTVRGLPYTLVGMKPRSRKFPFLGKRASDGKVYKFTASAVARGLAFPNAPKGSREVAVIDLNTDRQIGGFGSGK